jgi:aminocarboxymuconate-semialdehyde decarboxylase
VASPSHRDLKSSYSSPRKIDPDMSIDMHAHWVPRRLISESAGGRDWYGWRILKDGAGREYASLGEHFLLFSASEGTLEDPVARAKLRAEKDGISFEALMLTGLFWNYHLPEDAALAFCREVNQEVAEVQKAYPDRFCGMALLPMQHRAAALAELDYVATNLDLRTIVIASNVRGLNLDDPTVLPIIEQAARMGFSICVHPTIWEKAADARLPRYSFANSFGAPLESSIAAMSLVYGGLLDKFPDVKIMFTQGGGWMHYGVGRLDQRYHTRANSRPMKMPPADYLGRMYYDCLVHDDKSLGFLAERVGTDRIMLGTDYPASGGIIGGAVKWIEAQSQFSDEDKAKILSGNARRFLGL